MQAIQLKFVVSGKNELVEAGQQIGAAFSAGIESGINRANESVRSLHSNLEKIQRLGGGSAFLQEFGQSINQVHARLGGVNSTIGEISTGILKISALSYVFERIGGSISSSVIAPLEKMLQLTERSRLFEASVSTLTGQSGARTIDYDLARNLNNTPFSLDDSRQQFNAYSRIGPFAQQLAFGSVSESMGQFQQFQQILAGLQTLNPGVTAERLTGSIEGSLLGQALALRGVVRIDPDQLAELVGLQKQQDFKGRPELLMAALQRYTEAMVGPQAMAMRENVPSVALGHIESQLQQAAVQIGDSGIFDAVVAKLKGVADNLVDYVSSSEFSAKAKAISGSLEIILGNVSNALIGFVEGLTGRNIAHSADGVTEGVDHIARSLADASYQLPNNAKLAGEALQALGSGIATFADFLIRLNDKLAGTTSATDDQRAWLVSKRLTEMGFGLVTEQSVQKVGDQKIDGYVDWHDRVVANGPRADQIRSIVDKAGGISDTALLDPTFFRYLTAGSGGGSGFGGGAGAGRSSYALPHDVEAASRYLTGLAGTFDLSKLSGGFKSDNERDDQASADARLAMTHLTRTRNGGKSLMQFDAGELARITDPTLSAILDAAATGDLGSIGGLVAEYSRQISLGSIAMSAGPSAINQKVSEYGFGQAQNAKDPAWKAELYRRAMAGDTDLARQAAGAQGIGADQLSNVFGLTGLASGDRFSNLDAATKSQLGDIKRAKGPGVTGDIDATIQSLTTVQAASRAASAELDKLAASNQEGTKEWVDAKAAVTDFSAEAEKLQSRLHQLQLEVNPIAKAFVDFGDQLQKSLGSGIGNIFDALEGKAHRLRDVMAQLARSILKDSNADMGHAIASSLFGEPDKQTGAGGISGMVRSVMGLSNPGVPGLSGPGGSGLLGAGFNALGNWLYESSFPAVQSFAGAGTDALASTGASLLGAAFADGGVASQPTLGIFGEAGPEAFVPMHDGHVPLMIHADGGVSASLPHGRTIPAKFMADGGVLGGDMGVATMGSAPAWSNAAGGGAGDGDIHVHVHQHMNGKEIAEQVHTITRPQRQAEALRMLAPGGSGRRALGKR